MTNNYYVNKKWRENNKEKVLCYTKINWQIRTKKIKKENCSICGNNNAHAHHEDYNKPLEIIWLCPKHHTERHIQIKKELGLYKPKKIYIKKNIYKKNKLFNDALRLKNENKSYGEIAKILNISKGTAFKWLNKVNYK